jgi:acylpyruvate hydrolase
MRFASVLHDGQPYAVAIDDQTAVPLIGVAELGAQSPADLLRDPPLDRGAAFPLNEATIRPVIPRPEKVICVGLNYKAHIEETQREDSDYPVLFTKFANSLTGPYDTIACPPESEAIDYEGELAVIIGAAARRVSPDRALDYVAGYTVANDVTMRDYQYKTHQWLQGKAWDSSTPIGPYLHTPDEIDVTAVGLRTLLNGEKLQDSDTSLMIFDIPTLISTISEFTTLLPGDIILTGTPGGVGFRRDPQVFLKPGDEVAIEIDGLGAVRSQVVAESR